MLPSMHIWPIRRRSGGWTIAQARTTWHLPLVPLILAAWMWVFLAAPIRANGIPVQIYLDFVPFKATWTPAQQARGMAVVSANDEEVRVMAQDLPAPPVGSVYYAWLEQVDGGFLPVGPLTYAEDGTASITQRMPNLPYSENFAWVLVTLEHPDQVGDAPSADIALAGRLPNPVALPVDNDQTPDLLPVTGQALPATRTHWPPNGWAAMVLVLAGLIAFQWVRRRRQMVQERIPTAPSGHAERSNREEYRIP